MQRDVVRNGQRHFTYCVLRTDTDIWGRTIVVGVHVLTPKTEGGRAMEEKSKEKIESHL